MFVIFTPHHRVRAIGLIPRRWNIGRFPAVWIRTNSKLCRHKYKQKTAKKSNIFDKWDSTDPKLRFFGKKNLQKLRHNPLTDNELVYILKSLRWNWQSALTLAPLSTRFSKKGFRYCHFHPVFKKALGVPDALFFVLFCEESLANRVVTS